jgi:hypothetical protein
MQSVARMVGDLDITQCTYTLWRLAMKYKLRKDQMGPHGKLPALAIMAGACVSPLRVIEFVSRFKGELHICSRPKLHLSPGLHRALLDKRTLEIRLLMRTDAIGDSSSKEKPGKHAADSYVEMQYEATPPADWITNGPMYRLFRESIAEIAENFRAAISSKQVARGSYLSRKMTADSMDLIMVRLPHLDADLRKSKRVALDIDVLRTETLDRYFCTDIINPKSLGENASLKDPTAIRYSHRHAFPHVLLAVHKDCTPRFTYGFHVNDPKNDVMSMLLNTPNKGQQPALLPFDVAQPSSDPGSIFGRKKGTKQGGAPGAMAISDEELRKALVMDLDPVDPEMTVEEFTEKTRLELEGNPSVGAAEVVDLSWFELSPDEQMRKYIEETVLPVNKEKEESDWKEATVDPYEIWMKETHAVDRQYARHTETPAELWLQKTTDTANDAWLNEASGVVKEIWMKETIEVATQKAELDNVDEGELNLPCDDEVTVQRFVIPDLSPMEAEEPPFAKIHKPWTFAAAPGPSTPATMTNPESNTLVVWSQGANVHSDSEQEEKEESQKTSEAAGTPEKPSENKSASKNLADVHQVWPQISPRAKVLFADLLGQPSKRPEFTPETSVLVILPRCEHGSGKLMLQTPVLFSSEMARQLHDFCDKLARNPGHRPARILITGQQLKKLSDLTAQEGSLNQAVRTYNLEDLAQHMRFLGRSTYLSNDANSLTPPVSNFDWIRTRPNSVFPTIIWFRDARGESTDGCMFECCSK